MYMYVYAALLYKPHHLQLSGMTLEKKKNSKKALL